MKKYIKRIFSYLGLLSLTEKVNFYFQKAKNKKRNSQFKKENPSIVLPPDFYMYETFALDYNKIYYGGLTTAKWIINHFEGYLSFQNKHILDWGCGSGRVLRHLPDLIDNSNKVFGTDYNSKYINWCNDNIENIVVKKNELSPPLKFNNDFFDAIYGISIFTHLSEQMHFEWMKELNRVAKNNAIIILTTHGNCFQKKLTKKEKYKFDEGNLIEHKYKVEGNRLFVAYQSPAFFENLCKKSNLKILKHIAGRIKNNRPQQDVWILKKEDII